MRLDTKDVKLLGLLQSDSKRTTKEYALHLKLSVTAVYERIRRLEKMGVITKYVALVDKKKVNKSFLVLCHVKLTQHTKEHIEQFERQILKLKEVVECHHMSDDYDYILKVYVGNMEEYRDFMVTKLTALNHIGSTQSAFVIEEVKNSTEISL